MEIIRKGWLKININDNTDKVKSQSGNGFL